MIFSPDALLTAMTSGGERAVSVCLSLFSVYFVWTSLGVVAEKSGLSSLLSRHLSPFCKRVFRTDDERAASDASMCICCNVLGLGSAATPFGVSAVERLTAQNNAFGAKLLFVLCATGLQVVPTTAMALRAQAGSTAPADIFLPSLAATTVATAVAWALFWLWGRKR